MNGFAPNLIDIENKVPGQFLPSELECNKIQDCGGHHIEDHIFGNNSANITCICTEFETQAENGVPQTDLPSKFTVQKSKMAAAAILKSVKR